MLRYLSLFSGIGAFEKALTNLGVPFEVVNFSEIDKYAIQSYCSIHNISESRNLGDITKVDLSSLSSDIDLISYGFPCQDISIVGKQKGFFNDNGSLTRSGLFFKSLDVISQIKPKIAIAENVKALTSSKFSEQFNLVLSSLNNVGYNNYFKVLNSKDFGIPQNRERLFIISVRKDIDNFSFHFPKPFSLSKTLFDYLDFNVDNKYFLSNKMVSYISSNGTKNFSTSDCKINLDIARPITTAQGKRAGTSNYISFVLPSNFDLRNLSSFDNSSLFIRKLTPLECFRLMGFSDDDFYKCKSLSISDTQLYKQAGNSIVVSVLESLFSSLFSSFGSLLF